MGLWLIAALIGYRAPVFGDQASMRPACRPRSPGPGPLLPQLPAHHCRSPAGSRGAGAADSARTSEQRWMLPTLTAVLRPWPSICLAPALLEQGVGRLFTASSIVVFALILLIMAARCALAEWPQGDPGRLNRRSRRWPRNCAPGRLATRVHRRLRTAYAGGHAAFWQFHQTPPPWAAALMAALLRGNVTVSGRRSTDTAGGLLLLRSPRRQARRRAGWDGIFTHQAKPPALRNTSPTCHYSAGKMPASQPATYSAQYQYLFLDCPMRIPS